MAEFVFLRQDICFLLIPGWNCETNARRARIVNPGRGEKIRRAAETAQPGSGVAWLLTCHDRVDGDGIALIHEFPVLMLGGRRSGATRAVRILEGRHLIRAQRGRITIPDRPTLRDLADGRCGTAEAEYARPIGAA